MDTTGTAKATLPLSATITISNGISDRTGVDVEVTPNGGRVHFQNEDDEAYRLRLWKPGYEQASIDMMLPAFGRVSVMINLDQEFRYRVLKVSNFDDEVKIGGGGGGIRN
jgi:hypothetical protein